jgi:hypothetical protein
MSYHYSSSANDFNKLIKCLSTVSCCFSSPCPNLCTSLTYTASTKVTHAIFPEINPCSTETIIYPTNKGPMTVSNEVGYRRSGFQRGGLQKEWLPARWATEGVASSSVGYRRSGFQLGGLQEWLPERWAIEGVASSSEGYSSGFQRGGLQKEWLPARWATNSCGKDKRKITASARSHTSANPHTANHFTE